MGSALTDRDKRAIHAEAFVNAWATGAGLVYTSTAGKTPSIDGHIQLVDPLTGTNLYVNCQVKTGNSYVRELVVKRNVITLTVDATDISNWQSSNVPVVLIWVKQDELGVVDYALWAPVARRIGRATSVHIRKSARLDAKSVPRLLELARAHAGRATVPAIAAEPLMSSLKMAKRRAWSFFKRWRLTGSESPAFGHVKLSRETWRHVTRRGLSRAGIIHRMSLLPCARELVESAARGTFLRELDRKAHVRTELLEVRGTVRLPFRRPIALEVVLRVRRSKARIFEVVLHSIHELASA